MVHTASSYRRLTAYWIDRFLIQLCYAPVWIQVMAGMAEGRFFVSWKWLLACFVFQFGYRWFFLYFLGGTIGKLIFGLRVVSRHDPFSDLTLSQSFLRVIAEHLSFFFGYAPQALMFVRFDRTHLYDWIAETRVVQREARSKPPHRRWLVLIILVFFGFTESFTQAYYVIQALEIHSTGVFVNWSEAMEMTTK